MKKKYRIENDPNKLSEAKKYQNPIPSRTVILNYLKDLKQPTVFENIAKALSLSYSRQLNALTRRINAMIRDKQLVKNHHYFCPFGQVTKNIIGRVSIQDNFTKIVSFRDAKVSALLICNQAKIVFDGDIICAYILGLNKDRLLEAKIEKIIERNTHEIIGRYSKKLDTHFVHPISKSMPRHILLQPPEKVVKQNSLVKANIIIQPSFLGPAVAALGEVIEENSDLLTTISLTNKKYDIVNNFSKETLRVTKKFPTSVLNKEFSDRKDLRHLPFVTIDDEDAKDFDDAVYAHKSTTGGWKLYVAIADVSHYVKYSGILDKEAQRRSTSVYFPNYVIPMLPEVLSNEICSLKPKVDRLAIVCEMNVSKNAQLTRYRFYSAVINSKAKLSYNEVSILLKCGEHNLHQSIIALMPSILNLHDLYRSLASARRRRGAIDFDIVKTSILLDEDQCTRSIIPKYRNVAHKIIEECMLIANLAAAKLFAKHKVVAPYRVHHIPSKIKVKELKIYLKNLGIDFAPRGSITPKMYAVLLETVKDRHDFSNIQLACLKSMKQAIYTTSNHGHFGLAYKMYTHFTSPIRRYPDLLTHRIIKSILGEEKLGAKVYDINELEELCLYASIKERNADAASNEVEKWLKCNFLRGKIGDILTATITNITRYGLFIELHDVYIEDLISVSSINDDYYIFDDIRCIFTGRMNKKVYAIGTQIQVKITQVNLEDRKVNFVLVNDINNVKI